MKTKDIVVGEDYSFVKYQSRFGDAKPLRVTVLETGVFLQGNGYGYSQTAGTKNNVRVRFEDGTSGVIRPTKIVRTWAEQEELDKASAEYAAKEKARREGEYAQRAATAAWIESVLENQGAPLSNRGVYKEEVVEALRTAGFPKSPHGVLARFDVQALVRDNVVSGDVLRAVLNG